MKSIILVVLITTLTSSTFINTDDYEAELQNIASSFRQKILDEYECQNLASDARRVAQDIEHDLKYEDELTEEDKRDLERIKDDADALDEFIGAIGDCGSGYVPSEEKIIRANKRIGANFINVLVDKYCVDVQKVNISTYIVYIVKNKSLKNYTVSLKYKVSNSSASGNVTMGLPAKSVRSFYSNRKNQKMNSIEVTAINCKEF